MKFKYKKYGPHILRPVIPVEIVYKGRSILYEVLVDSGADLCVFDAEIGEVLGIDVVRGERQAIGGVTGTKESFFLHTITLKIGSVSYTARVGFLPNMARMSYGVLGQQGFFDHFVVAFDFHKKEIKLSSRER